MRKPFKAGRWELALADVVTNGWMFGTVGDHARVVTDADLRHIARLCAKALKYRHKGKGAK